MPEFPRDRNHLYLVGNGRSEPYTPIGHPIAPPPPQRNRKAHGAALEANLKEAVEGVPPLEQREFRDLTATPGFYLEFTLPPHNQEFVEKLENKTKKIELVAVSQHEGDEGPLSATVFVPQEEARYFNEKIQAYRTELTPKKRRPKNEPLVARLEYIRLANLKSLFTDRLETFPNEEDQVWWEVWLRSGRRDQFLAALRELNVQFSHETLTFPEREVLMARTSAQILGRLVVNSDFIAEVRLPKDNPTHFLEMGNPEQAEWAAEMASRVVPPPNGAPAVCILDSGITRGHPLIQIALNEADEHRYDPNWPFGDSENWGGHGTAMGGTALFGDLQPLLISNGNIQLTHRIESAKILPPTGQNDPKLYGAITAYCVSLAEIQEPQRSRVCCLAVTSEGEHSGRPSSWSAKIDDLCHQDHRRLFVISAGNYRGQILMANYPNANDNSGVENPAQAWNAIAVGGVTEKTEIADATYAAWQPVAPLGDLAPTSRTSVTWQRQWPIKPDVVVEAGNFAENHGPASPIDVLRLLTTHHNLAESHFRSFGDTSCAAAQLARMAAQIVSAQPALWPETIRGLIIHSAEWTGAMKAHIDGAANKAEQHSLFRRYGYGVPDLQRALLSTINDLTLVAQDELQPFKLERSSIKANEMNLHELPWPKQELEALGDAQVELRVTLSYFIEPNPAERGWFKRHKYSSHGLRFALKRATETVAAFRSRINRAAQVPGDLEVGTGGDNWLIGAARNVGSIHSDYWRGQAADLAEKGVLGIFPIGGWWRENRALDRYHLEARYSLIVSIKALSAEVDIYTPVLNQIQNVVPVAV